MLCSWKSTVSLALNPSPVTVREQPGAPQVPDACSGPAPPPTTGGGEVPADVAMTGEIGLPGGWACVVPVGRLLLA